MREEGYYFVKYQGDWNIGYFNPINFYPWVTFRENEVSKEEELNEIGDKIELPKN
jgi:hypothetical protein